MLSVTHIAIQAPGQPELRLLREIGVLDNMSEIEMTRVAGERATRTEIARVLRKPTDLMIWSGHGRANQLVIADGGSVSGPWLATQLRAGAPRLAVIAVCGSDVADDRLRSVTTAIARRGINVIGFPLETNDATAATYIVELTRALVAGADVGSAHEVALEEIGGDDLVAARGIELRAGLLDGYREIIDRMRGFDARLGRVETVVDAVADHFGVEYRGAT